MDGSYRTRTVGSLVAVAFLLAGCGGQESAVSEAPAGEEPTTTETAAAGTTTESTTGGEPAVLEGAATLAEQGTTGVSGDATLRWDPQTGALSVDVEVEGLEDGATYIAVIAAGCQPPPQRIHKLGSITGAPDGGGRLTAEVDGVDTVDLDGGWVILIGRPQVGPQACGEVGPA